MYSLENILSVFIKVSLVLTTIQIYLRVNKIWKRKHEREVADSQSIAGLFLYFMNCVLWLFYYVIQNDFQSLIDTSLYMVEAGVFLIISTGLFVRGQARIGLWKLAKQAFRLERKESTYLIKRFFRPANAESILNMLHQLAMIDDDLDPKEKHLLESFAKEWNIHYDPDKLDSERQKDSSLNYIRLRKNLKEYLEGDPPREQVAQFRDMMQAIINADDKITKEEELINSELMGIISGFLNKDQKPEKYHVLIVPQKDEHEDFIKDLLPDSAKISVSGGVAYSIGSFYSSTYADMICRQYRQIKLFTIVHSPDDGDLEVSFGDENNNDD